MNEARKILEWIDSKDKSADPSPATNLEFKIHGYKVESKVSEDVIKQAVHFLHLNWNHHVDKVFPAKSILDGKVHASWYDSPDKGGYSLFAVNKEGNVIYGLVFDEPSKTMSIYPTDSARADLEE